MSNVTNIKTPSPLVKAVVALDNHLSDLNRLGTKIEAMELQSDFDFEQAQRHIDLFAKAGQSVSDEIVTMATALNDARAQAEAMAQMVSARAEILAARKLAVQAKMEELRVLGESVRTLTVSLAELKPATGVEVSPTDQAQMAIRLSDADSQIRPMIEKANALKKEAQEAKMKVLEQSADSLSQSLTAISRKLSAFQPNPSSH